MAAVALGPGVGASTRCLLSIRPARTRVVLPHSRQFLKGSQYVLVNCPTIGLARSLILCKSAQTETYERPTVETPVKVAVDPIVEERRRRRKQEQVSYQTAAIAASVFVTVLAISATYWKFAIHMGSDEDFPVLDMFGTLALVFGGVFGMEMWARYAHKNLWHDYEPGWVLHKTHHEPRKGPFEGNDIFAIINGVPAMALCAYGFFTPNTYGSLTFGAGMGITLFGIMYMFVHDGLVHKRFPTGPIAELPYLKRVAVAHQLHHANKFDGAPWGLFLGAMEVEALPGGKEELDRLVAEASDKS